MTDKRILPMAIVLISALLATATTVSIADTRPVLELYVDTASQQIFAEPGPGRVKLGNFQLVDDNQGTDGLTDSGELEQRMIQRQQNHEQEMERAIARVNENNDSPRVRVSNGGLDVTSDDGAFTMNLGGRIHADLTAHDGDEDLIRSGSLTPTEATSGTVIRRSRLALSGTAFSDYHYHIQGDWAGNSVSMKDVLVTYTGIDTVEITLGNQKHAMSMEVEESSNDIMFNERSLLSALSMPAFDRAIGLKLKSSGEDWSLQGGVYGDAFSSSGDGADEGNGWAVRGTFTPVNSSGRVLHLGANLGRRSTNDNNTLLNSKSPRFRHETTSMSDLYLSDTGTITDFDDVTLGILEGAAMSGPFSVQGEYGRASVDRENHNDVDFTAWYAQAAWTLTGESRSYRGSDGEFKRLRPARNFDPARGAWGAWELALRYDQLDLTDNDLVGGEQDRLSLNLNWYMNPSLRILFGYSRAFDVTGGPVITTSGGQPDDIDVFNIRTQWAF